ncbi:MAG: DUF1223 domain-containing protein [Rhizobiales bacterium]|nr:DUF1223 domain-containing protein [Hyphomicrobiales bacterium]
MLPNFANADPRAVLELFTSQGCSSCPPADRLLGALARDPSIVAISMPVDYWDYIGWKDTLADPRNASRQRAYAQVRGDRQVYTPQLVVNGSVHVVGSDKSAIEQAITNTSRSGTAMSVPVKLAASNGTITVNVGEGAVQKAGEVWLYAVTTEVPVKIGRGENAGRSVTYYNVCRNWVKLGDWNGKAASWNIPADKIKTDGVNAAVAIVQSGHAGNPGATLGAAFTPLN